MRFFQSFLYVFRGKFVLKTYIFLLPGSCPHLVGAGQLQFKAEKLLDGSHGDSAGAADEPLHQILIQHKNYKIKALKISSGQNNNIIFHINAN